MFRQIVVPFRRSKSEAPVRLSIHPSIRPSAQPSIRHPPIPPRREKVFDTTHTAKERARGSHHLRTCMEPRLVPSTCGSTTVMAAAVPHTTTRGNASSEDKQRQSTTSSLLKWKLLRDEMKGEVGSIQHQQ